MQSTDASAADYSETGAFGDPTLASAEKGRVILDAMIGDLVDGLIALFRISRSERRPSSPKKNAARGFHPGGDFSRRK
jgi:hypothetical protein